MTVLDILASSAIATLFSVLFNSWFSQAKDKATHKKELIARACQAISNRVELCYLIQRRVKGDVEDMKNIRDAIHENQEEINYYRGLLRLESKSLGIIYDEYVRKIGELTGLGMQKSWRLKNASPDLAIENGILLNHREIDTATAKFIQQARPFTRLFLPCQLVGYWLNRGVVKNAR